ncbi:MAG: hypothetical protein HZB67_04150 [Candidatus Aenigmarchaeota archaeon]|nr:hypothetical protein [Candidatus Aenigmarchaeota archaeon]
MVREKRVVVEAARLIFIPVGFNTRPLVEVFAAAKKSAGKGLFSTIMLQKIPEIVCEETGVRRNAVLNEPKKIFNAFTPYSPS